MQTNLIEFETRKKFLSLLCKEKFLCNILDFQTFILTTYVPTGRRWVAPDIVKFFLNIKK